MELVPGVTLEKILESSPQATTEETLSVIRQLAEALDHAHQNHVIHRDLKPANILVTMDGRAKITDFGVAKVFARQSATRTLAVTGTPSFMSPEQVKGGEVDARTDIFSLGVILFTMLVGKKPFSGNTAAVMFKIVFEEPPAPSTLNPQLTPAHDYVVRRCLAKDVNQRYPSAREVLNDLDDLEHSRPPRSQAGASAHAPVATPPSAAAPRLDRTAAIPSPGVPKPAVPLPAPPTLSATPLQRVAPPPKQVPISPIAPATHPAGPPTLAMPVPGLVKGGAPPAAVQRPPSAPLAAPSKPIAPSPVVAPSHVDSAPLTGQTLNMRVPGIPATPPPGAPPPPVAATPSAFGGLTMIGRALTARQPDPPVAAPPSLPRAISGPPIPPGPMPRPVPVQMPGNSPVPPAAGPPPPRVAPTPPPGGALATGPAETPGAVSTAPKSKLLPVALAGVTVVLLVGDSFGLLGFAPLQKCGPACPGRSTNDSRAGTGADSSTSCDESR